MSDTDLIRTRFDVRPGPVMVASYEDPAGVLGWRLRELASVRGVADTVLSRIHVAHTAGLPLHGPDNGGMYTARPGPSAAGSTFGRRPTRSGPPWWSLTPRWTPATSTAWRHQ